MAEAYEKLLEKIRRIGRLSAVEALLDWDQQTYMPSGSVKARAEMRAEIESLTHVERTSDELGKLLDSALADGDPARETNIRETRRLRERAVRLPAELVHDLAYTASMAQSVWEKAKNDNDYASFEPILGKLLELKRAQADAIGYEEDPYDALMDEFEPGARSSQIDAVFSKLREALVPFVSAIAESSNPPDDSVLHRRYPRPGQEQMARRFTDALGFDSEHGRLDASTHPFCTSFSPDDVRITTRYNENHIAGGLFSLLHETGHALYELGLPAEHAFTPAGSAVSLGIHESQSRLWENYVGRSRPFWDHQYPWLTGQFPESLSDVPVEEFYRAINTVRPSLIRVEADEVTYNLHIILRFELERDMIAGRLAVRDIPEAFDAKMESLVGIRPPDDTRGCLQDIHWSCGIFGYFPTYALGNLYAAQFFAAAKSAISDLEDQLRHGEYGALLNWLRTEIHAHGMRYRADELCQRVTGKPLTIEPFMDYLTTKFKPIYGLD